MFTVGYMGKHNSYNISSHTHTNTHTQRDTCKRDSKTVRQR